MNLSYGYKTHVGRAREANQDSMAILTSDDLDGLADGLFVVADGMGGLAGGETASRIAAETVSQVVREVLAESDATEGGGILSEALREGLLSANDAVWKESKSNPELRGMGTTCVAALVLGDSAVIGNVGDSRAYLLRDGVLRQITNDHSLVEEHVRAGELTPLEARMSRYRNVITRAIGIAGKVEPDVDPVDLEEGDTILLCSDGLTNMLADEDIADILLASKHSQHACEQLVEAANRSGGLDNITAVVIQHGEFVPTHRSVSGVESWVESSRNGSERTAAPSGSRGRAAFQLFLTLLVLAMGGALYYVAQNGWPPKTAASHPVPRDQPVHVDLATVEYGEPAALTSKPVRQILGCDQAGNLTVITMSGRIQRVDRKGLFSGEFGAPVQFAQGAVSHHACVDAQGFVYVSARAARQIYKYNPNGTRIKIIGAGSLESPADIAVDGQGNLYVLDGPILKMIRAINHQPSTINPPGAPDAPR